MSDWLEFLKGRAPRVDLDADFPAERIDQDQPVWLSKAEVLCGAAVASRVMEVIAHRGGTRLGAAVFQSLRKMVSSGLDESARNLCEDEARRVLRWIEEARPAEDAEVAGPPEVEVMYASDLESRVSVARFAIEEGFDLEMEYYDEGRELWPRVRCEPLVVKGAGETHSDEATDLDEIVLRFEGRHGEEEVPLRRVRWLMPVQRREQSDVERREPGEVIKFPAGRVVED